MPCSFSVLAARTVRVLSGDTCRIGHVNLDFRVRSLVITASYRISRIRFHLLHFGCERANLLALEQRVVVTTNTIVAFSSIAAAAAASVKHWRVEVAATTKSLRTMTVMCN